MIHATVRTPVAYIGLIGKFTNVLTIFSMRMPFDLFSHIFVYTILTDSPVAQPLSEVYILLIIKLEVFESCKQCTYRSCIIQQL